MVAWGVEFHGDGGVSPSWIELVCDVSMVPVSQSAAVESPGWLFLRWEAVRTFARFCARGDFCWDAFGAEANKLLGRCCAAILILVAFITGNSSLEPLIVGLYAQIHVNLR